MDWEVDESIQNPLQGTDHASMPTEGVKESSRVEAINKSSSNKEETINKSSSNEVKPVKGSSSSKEETTNKSSSNEVEFKEILCPHNNIATAAMLGGIFEGEQVNQEVQGNESGTYLFLI